MSETSDKEPLESTIAAKIERKIVKLRVHQFSLTTMMAVVGAMCALCAKEGKRIQRIEKSEWNTKMIETAFPEVDAFSLDRDNHPANMVIAGCDDTRLQEILSHPEWLSLVERLRLEETIPSRASFALIAKLPDLKLLDLDGKIILAPEDIVVLSQSLSLRRVTVSPETNNIDQLRQASSRFLLINDLSGDDKEYKFYLDKNKYYKKGN